jgi:hydroxymethylpyrimidine/phosphomethylpyrimidine kinase / thiaminase
LEDVNIHAIKTGMLFDGNITHVVADTLQKLYRSSILPPIICDPVCVSTTGHTLLHPQAIEVMIRELFPLTALITPNKSEAELLLSHRRLPCKIVGLEDMLIAAKNLTLLGPPAVLLKGGHITVTAGDIERVSRSHAHILFVNDGFLNENMEILEVADQDLSNLQPVVDVLYQHDKTTLFIRPRIDSTSTHGTGCTLSAALACGLGRGLSCLFSTSALSSLIILISLVVVFDAVKSATAYAHLGIETAFSIGTGSGPLNHLHSFVPRIISP